jgi:hypothetical protein
MAQKIWSVNDIKYGNDYLKDLGFDVLLMRQIKNAKTNQKNTVL